MSEMSFANLAVERDAKNAAHFRRPSPLRYISILSRPQKDS